MCCSHLCTFILISRQVAVNVPLGRSLKLPPELPEYTGLFGKTGSKGRAIFEPNATTTSSPLCKKALLRVFLRQTLCVWFGRTVVDLCVVVLLSSSMFGLLNLVPSSFSIRLSMRQSAYWTSGFLSSPGGLRRALAPTQNVAGKTPCLRTEGLLVRQALWIRSGFTVYTISASL